jgi:hypothetical protein
MGIMSSRQHRRDAVIAVIHRVLHTTIRAMNGVEMVSPK